MRMRYVLPATLVLLCITMTPSLHGQIVLDTIRIDAPRPTTSASASVPITGIIPARDPRYGVYGTADADFHRSDFQMLPGVPNCCADFNGGSGGGFSLGFLFEYPVSDRWWLGGRLSYEHVAAEFIEREPTTFIVNGKATDAAFEHRLDGRYGVVTLAPTAGFVVADNLFDVMALVAHAGFGLGITSTSSYNQSETIVEPGGIGVYTTTGTEFRNEYSGEIPEATSFAADLRIGLSFDVPINRSSTLLLSPEIWYSFGMTPVASSVDWYVHALRGGLALRFSPLP